MRGTDERSGSLFSFVDLEARVPKDHPLRAIREIANGALLDLSADFAAMYAPLGRPSIPPSLLASSSRAASTTPHAAAMPIAGAPRTISAWIATATALAVRQSTYSTVNGSLR